MTAIVGIINRNGAAFAADSAATHTLSADKKKKITNHANKIFELSRYKPIGVALCGNLAFNGLLWEDTIKLYRSQLDKKSFPHVRDYLNDFMNYVTEKILPSFVDDANRQIKYLCNCFKNEIIDISIKELEKRGFVREQLESKDIFPVLCEKLKEFSLSYSKKEMRNENGFHGYTKQKFKKYAMHVIKETTRDLCKDGCCPRDFLSLYVDALYYVLTSNKHIYQSITELIFWGYGDEDMFPSCHSITISAAFDSHVKWVNQSNFSVSNTTPSWIIPYAQTDVSNTVVRGVDQKLREMFSSKANVIMTKFRNDIVNKMVEVGAPKVFSETLSGLNIQPYVDLFTNEMNIYIQKNYVDKLMDTVSSLMKEDLADMAESLVRMTCLKRHFTTDDETVGGPVDVAVATRGDGLVWIKRKHYFPADINHHYFER